MTETAQAAVPPRTFPPLRRKRPLHRFADWLDAWHVTRIMTAVSAFAILIAIIAFGIDMVDRTEERIVWAWQLVTTKSPGNSGKIRALEYLNSQVWWRPFKKREPLIGVDLSVDKGEVVYLRMVDLSGANLNSAILTGADLAGANLSDASLIGANLRRAFLRDANLTGAKLSSANLSDASLWDANLTGARLPKANLSDAKLGGANLSGIDFERTEGLTQDQLDTAWAWRLHPPVGLPGGFTLARLCEGTEKDIQAFENSIEERRKSAPFGTSIVPDGC